MRHLHFIFQQLLLFSTSALLFSLASSAKVYAQPELSWTAGPVVGLNISDIPYENNDINSGVHFGFAGGGFGKFNVGRFFIQQEAMFSMKGAKFTNEFIAQGGARSFVNSNYDYYCIDLPLMLGVRVLNLEMFRLRLLAGPLFTFNIYQKSDVQFTDANQDVIFLQETKMFQPGFQAGFGIDLGRFMFDARYERSFVNIASDAAQKINTDSFYNSTFRLTVGFKIKKEP